MKNVAILLFDDVEVLDFCGPFEVFSVAKSFEDQQIFDVFTVAEKAPIIAWNGLSVNPSYLLSESPQFSILIIPGGQGTRREINNSELIAWIKRSESMTDLTMSVCTGALLLGKAGILDGLEVTTHFQALSLLQEICPKSRVSPHRRFIDNQRIATSAGISAGIDLSLHIVSRLCGKDIAIETAKHMEYEWHGV